jgi:hypothetical protein
MPSGVRQEPSVNKPGDPTVYDLLSGRKHSTGLKMRETNTNNMGQAE